MLTVGTWKVAEKNRLYVVVEVYKNSAYAYLWDKAQGIRSHVWLFNCEAADAERDQSNDAPPAMPPDNVMPGLMVPDSVDEISCVFNVINDTWELYWADRKMAALNQEEQPGRSALVKTGNDLAKPFEAETD